MNDALRDARTRLTSAWAGKAHPLFREQALETFARDLRQAWLTRAAEATSQNFRSPTGMQTPLTQTGSAHHFGYERDLRPDELEQKCHDFFRAVAGGVVRGAPDVFGSGQAAMTATLILLDCEPGLVPSLRPMRVAHLGTYFETTALLRLFPTAIELAEGASGFDAAIVEPVWCDGSFGTVDMMKLATRLAVLETQPKAIIVDSTLRGRHDTLDEFLAHLHAPGCVFRVNSGLKLFQSGLELANVGILSVFGRDRATVKRGSRTGA